MNIYFYDLIIGQIGISEADGKITNLFFENDKLPDNITVSETAVLKDASSQLRQYLCGELESFSLPLAPKGTDFMKKVWKSLCEIPYGKVASYKEIALKVGSPKAARAVGLANNRNPIPIFIPCHRVVGSDGSLVGYRGGIQVKEQLLFIEMRSQI